MNWDILRQFQDGLQEIGIAGNDLAVYAEGKPVYRYFTGWQNREKRIPITEKTLFRMFSMTKPVTCAAALQLLEEGRFLMNEPLSDYLPEFGQMTVRREDGTLSPAEKPLRIEHLFTMTSGLDYDRQVPEMTGALAEYGDGITTRQYARAIARKPLCFEPGSRWLYGLSHDVLGALIEVLSGKKFSEYLKERIFDPLGMKESWFREPEERKADVCLRYGRDGEGNWHLSDQQNHHQPGQHESGGAGLTMTTEDYARFACALTNGGMAENGKRILAGRTVELMRSNTLNGVPLRDFQNGSPARAGYGYGFGVRTLIDPAASGGLSPVGEFGWGGAWGTYTLLDPENRVTVVYCEQAEDTKAVYIQRRLRNMVYAALGWEKR